MTSDNEVLKSDASFQDRFNRFLQVLADEGHIRSDAYGNYIPAAAKEFFEISLDRYITYSDDRKGTPNYEAIQKITSKLKEAFGSDLTAVQRIEHHILYLLGIRDDLWENKPVPLMKTEQGVRWIEYIPAYDNVNNWDVSKPRIERGIRFFNCIMQGNSTVECFRSNPHFEGFSLSDINFNLRCALWAKCIRLADVERHNELEDKIRDQFDLHHVIVARLPRDRTSGRFIDANIVSTELVSFLAARHILIETRPNNRIGIGPGYTMERLAHNSIPSVNTISSVIWSPLHTFEDPQYAADTRTSNNLVILLKNMHPESRAEYLPYVEPQFRPFVNPPEDIYLREQRTQADHVLNSAKMSLIIASVGGTDERGQLGTYIGSMGTSYGFPDMARLYRECHDPELAGEILGYLIRNDGTPAGDDHIQKRNKEISFAMPLEDLRNHDNLWIVAAGSYKSHIVKTVIIAGYAKSLVIDEEIAEKLVEDE